MLPIPPPVRPPGIGIGDPAATPTTEHPAEPAAAAGLAATVLDLAEARVSLPLHDPGVL